MQKYLVPDGDCVLVVDEIEAVEAFEHAVSCENIYHLLILDTSCYQGYTATMHYEGFAVSSGKVSMATDDLGL
jgi:hypothetical protein